MSNKLLPAAKKPQLTRITSEAQVVGTVNNLVAAMQLLAGQNQDKLERAVTFKDLRRSGFSLASLGDGSFDVVPPGGDVDEPDLTVPPAMTGVHFETTLTSVLVFWNPAGYKRHAYVEIWIAAATKKVGGLDVPTVLSDAHFYGTCPTTAIAIAVPPGDSIRIWLRNVGQNTKVGPWYDIAGSVVKVPDNPTYLLDKISGEIRESHLYPALGGKINLASSQASSHQELLASSYTLRLDTGNAVHGFGIAIDPNSKLSDFIVRADRFAIAAPQQYDQNGKPIVQSAAFPFVVDVTDVNNPKVLIKNAYISSAYIESLVAGKVNASYINALNLSAVNISGGHITIGNNFNVDVYGNMTCSNAFFKGTAQSSNFVSGSAGWRVLNSGNAEFNNAVVRGTVYATDGWFKGTVYAEKLVGGAFTRKVYPSNTNADVQYENGDVGAWMTAKRVSVTRGMSVSRTLRIYGQYAHYYMYVIAEGAGSGALSNGAEAKIEVRIVRDGSIVVASAEVKRYLVATSTPSGSPPSSESGRFGIELLASIPSDSAAHYYDLQFRFKSIVDTPTGYCYITIGSSSTDSATAEMYIESGDLA